MKQRAVTMVLAGVAAALSGREASAQQFCLSAGCGTMQPTTYYPHALDAPTGDPLASVQWMRGFVRSATPVAGGDVSPPTTQPLPTAFGTLAVPAYNSLGSLTDEASPLVVGLVGATMTRVAVATNHSVSKILAVPGYMGMRAELGGYWSDPAIACSNTRCVAVAADTNNRVAIFVFNGSTVTANAMLLGSEVTGIALNGATHRPAIVTLGSDRFGLVRRYLTASAVSELRFYEINTVPATPAITEMSTPLSAATLTPASPIVASATGGSMLVAYAQSTGAAQTIHVLAVAASPMIGARSAPVEVLRRTGPFRSLDIARSATSYVLSWQEATTFYRMALQSVSLGGGTYGVAYRAAIAATDRLAGFGLVRTHRMASGPRPLVVFDEIGSTGGATVPRALGYVIDVCRSEADCDLSLGAGWVGTCSSGLCVPAAAMDAGAPDVVTSDASSSDSATVRDSGAAMDSGASSDDGAVTADANAPLDSASSGDGAAPDASDDSAMNDSASAADAKLPEGVGPQITGGACACRAVGHGRSSWGVCALALAAAAVGSRRRRG